MNTAPAPAHDALDDAPDSADFDDLVRARRPWVLRPAALGVFLIVTSVIGFLSSFTLSVEKYEKLENPEASLSCDLNPFFSCGSVMEFPQSQLFGFPNQLLGVAAFVFPLLIGVLLVARAQLPGWVMVGLNIGLALGVALVMFLFHVSIYDIGVGCPWCMVVWTMTIPMFCAVTAHNALAGNFGARIRDSAIVRVLARENVAIALVWLLIIAACVVVQFWAFFSTLI